MKLFKNSVNSLVALVDSEDIVDISNYATSATTTTLTIPAVNNKDINFVNYGGVAWTLAPDTNEGLTINKSTAGITVNAGKSISLRYDTLAKNFIIAGRSEATGGGGGSQTLADTLALGNDAGSVKITNLGTPTVNSDATTKLYVDTALNGKQNTLTAGTNITIDNTNPLAPIINASGGGGSFTASTQAQGEAAASNTAVNTPTPLDTNTGIAPNVLWYSLQEYKEYFLEAFTTLTYGATVTWDGIKSFNQAKVTATGNFILDNTNTKSGSSGLLKIIVNTTSAITVTFDTDFTNKIVSTTALNYTFSTGVANREYWLQYTLEGTVMTWFVSDDKVEFPVYTGDITTTSIGGATINANAVTHAKYQTIANNTMLGNNSGSTGVPQELSGVLYDTIPPKDPYDIKGASYPLVRAVDYEVELTVTGSITLPASPQEGDVFIVRNNGAAITVTIVGTINTIVNPTITTRYEAIRAVYNGTVWVGNRLAAI